jgi:uncharacterized protein (TIGR02246 family)
MKLRLLATAGLAVGLVAPAVAQERATACDGPRDACQQIVALARAYDAAFNSHDIAGVAGLYTEDAVWMPEGPALSGRGAIEKFLAGLFKMGLSNEVLNVREAHVAGDTAWAVGDWRNSGPGPNQTIQQYHGNGGVVYARAGDGWKIRMATTNLIENEAAGR